MISVLIKGSTTDCTKQAIISYHGAAEDSVLLLPVRDELLILAPAGAGAKEMKILEQAMADVAFDVQMLSDGKAGANWGGA